MMDYKELIRQLRCTGIPDGCYIDRRCDECSTIVEKQAATAIETLLAERDAAISAIPKDCSKCTYWGRLKTESPCIECWYSSGPRKNWQWRGMQKADYTYMK